ncbi:MAG: sensor histidine kinase [Candidatus Margulisiibacteriota bacterium]
MVFLTLRYYIALNEYHEENLQIALQQVETTLTQLQSAHATLWETNKSLTQKAQFATMTQHIAHEIKNPLSLMTNVPDLMSQYAKSPDDIEKIANILRGTIANLYNLVETLLHQNSLSISATSTFELESMVRALLTMSKGDLCLKNVQATLDFESNLPLIYGHEGAIQNVIINLMVNAIQAGATKLEFSAKRTEGGVLFGLRDNAGGIAPEIMDQIFEEGFSTKVGNSGFGLTFVKEVVAAQGGKLHITTEQGLGTTFQVTFQINQKLT